MITEWGKGWVIFGIGLLGRNHAMITRADNLAYTIWIGPSEPRESLYQTYREAMVAAKKCGGICIAKRKEE